MNRIEYIFKTVFCLCMVVFMFSSCEKLVFGEDLESTDPMVNFEYLWNECDRKYVYFGLKNVDWNAVKTEYSAKIYEGMTDDSLFNVLAGMITELRDDHTNLSSNFNNSFFGVGYLGQDNFDWRIVEENYLDRKTIYAGSFSHAFLTNTDKQIGYIRFGAFNGDAVAHIDDILEKYKDTKGIILDLRENGGGAVNDVFAILSRFVESETLLFYSRIKKGSEHDDFTSAEPYYLSPSEGKLYTNPVAVLVDRGTYSSGSITSLSTKAIPNLTLIGDTTGGGLGLPNGGQLPNGWNYRFSVSQTLTVGDKKPDYEDGVPPDIHVNIDWTNRTTDEIIEAAKQHILQ